MNLVHQMRHDLKAKLGRDRLTHAELLEGVRQCFMITQREFFARRRPEMSTEEIFRISEQIVNDAYQANGISASNLIMPALMLTIETLNQHFEFSQDPELVATHNAVIEMLLAKIDNG